MKVFVTGGTGVVGRRAVPMLIAAGHEVTAAGRSRERLAALERAGARTLALDLFDRAAVERAVAGQEVVVNLATHIPPSSTRMMLPGAWRENDHIRREGSALLAGAALAAGATRFVQESFAPVYADGGADWLDERAPVRVVRYNRTVLDAERSAASVAERGRVGVVLRFAGFYGPDATQLRDMVKLVRAGVAPLPGAADAYCSWASHDDAASAVVAALALPSGTYNVCDDEPLTRREFADAVAGAFRLPRPKLLPPWTTVLMGSLGELLARSERISNRKLRSFGWAPRWPSVREGLRAVAEEWAHESSAA